ncbi:28S ribosomal protein S7, mitochondrial [Leptopilina heterotoma]|uniref:28S ribosomal protein S7, mitochondrial n=1 Tax=Leptopilina heterotoma TaxID=63436 RepID=UPI001CA99F46|nr:28S ribosomal protein S7, mitochondrial [Leptopilina heterotoma]
MASLCNLVTRGLIYNPFKGLERLTVIYSAKNYSVFPKSMRSPVFKEDEQLELEEDKQLQKLSLQHILPAFSNHTCSEFHDPLTRKFTNFIMRKGKKVVADNELRKCFTSMKRIQIERFHKAETQEEKDEIELDPITILHKAVENASPALETVKLRRGGVKYDVPHPLSAKRSEFLAMNWLIQAAQVKERTVHFYDCLARELINASNNTGSVVKRKLELHKHCEANRAYAHFRWN